jgi:hypothetical protein
MDGPASGILLARSSSPTTRNKMQQTAAAGRFAADGKCTMLPILPGASNADD